jgi:hypothetical protein
LIDVPQISVFLGISTKFEALAPNLVLIIIIIIIIIIIKIDDDDNDVKMPCKKMKKK